MYSLKIAKSATGVITIKGDEHLLPQLEGVNLDAVDVSEYRVTADELEKAFQKAVAQPVKNVKGGQVNNVDKYGALKKKFMDTFSA